MTRDLEHRRAFEQMGETAARALACQGGDIAAQASAWVGEQEALREDEAAAKRDAREERALEFAADSLSSSKEQAASAARAAVAAERAAVAAERQARWALYAAIIAVIAAVIATKDQILTLIFGSP